MVSKVASMVVPDELEMQKVSRRPTDAPEVGSRDSLDELARSHTMEKVPFANPNSSVDYDPDSGASALYSSEEEQTVIKKFDRHLVLFIAFLYMLGFLDRSST